MLTEGPGYDAAPQTQCVAVGTRDSDPRPLADALPQNARPAKCEASRALFDSLRRIEGGMRTALDSVGYRAPVPPVKS